jgi:hypothetical protein
MGCQDPISILGGFVDQDGVSGIQPHYSGWVCGPGWVEASHPTMLVWNVGHGRRQASHHFILAVIVVMARCQPSHFSTLSG